MHRKITSNLYIGSGMDAISHGDEFDAVVSLADENKFTTDKYLLTDGDHNYEKFSSAVDTIREHIREDNTVLVHCRAGISRSVSAAIAAYVCETDVSFDIAFDECTAGHTYPDNRLLDSAKQYINFNTEEE